MKGHRILFTGFEQVETVETDFAKPENLFRDELFLKTEYTLISPGTELACLRGTDLRGKKYPKCLGYSGICRVLAMGNEVNGFEVGDRVLVYHSSHSSYLVKKQRDVVKVPEGLAPEDAIFAVVGCMGFQGVRKVRPELGESMMVMGLGLLGQIAAQCCALSGAFPLIALDFNEKRRDIALKHGTNYAFSPDEPELAQKVKELTRGGKGVNCVIEVTGNPAAVKQGLKMTAPLGRVALVGCSRTPTLEIDFYNDVHRPGIKLIGAHNYVRPAEDSYPGYWTMREDMALLMDLIKAGRVNTRCLLTDMPAPKDAPGIYKRFVDGDPDILGVVFDWTGE